MEDTSRASSVARESSLLAALGISQPEPSPAVCAAADTAVDANNNSTSGPQPLVPSVHSPDNAEVATATSSHDHVEQPNAGFSLVHDQSTSSPSMPPDTGAPESNMLPSVNQSSPASSSTTDPDLQQQDSHPPRLRRSSSEQEQFTINESMFLAAADLVAGPSASSRMSQVAAPDGLATLASPEPAVVRQLLSPRTSKQSPNHAADPSGSSSSGKVGGKLWTTGNRFHTRQRHGSSLGDWPSMPLSDDPSGALVAEAVNSLHSVSDNGSAMPADVGTKPAMPPSLESTDTQSSNAAQERTLLGAVSGEMLGLLQQPDSDERLQQTTAGTTSSDHSGLVPQHTHDHRVRGAGDIRHTSHAQDSTADASNAAFALPQPRLSAPGPGLSSSR